ncbi:MAG: hypothetical protein A2289_02805 [Deltaproteobacteria bacterium RIFOXYA12_FULL_58_15]|nr:MAG: hypothetical protein A2289_02805 [Deltaproteobacteria bacterium RIFOXYA12_FULL_58_15]
MRFDGAGPLVSLVVLAACHTPSEGFANHTTIIRLAATGTPPSPAQSTPSAGIKKEPMDALAFAKFLAGVKKESLASSRIKLIALAAESNDFTADQVGSVIGAMDFPDNRLQALKLLAKRIVDPQNHHTIIASFEYTANKMEAAEILSPLAQTGRHGVPARVEVKSCSGFRLPSTG